MYYLNFTKRGIKMVVIEMENGKKIKLSFLPPCFGLISWGIKVWYALKVCVLYQYYIYTIRDKYTLYILYSPSILDFFSYFLVYISIYA